jgi:hypothetical protein
MSTRTGLPASIVLRFEKLESRICLSGGVAPRGGGPTPPTLFHTPVPGDADTDGVTVPRGFPAPSAGIPVILDLGGGRVAFLSDEAAQGVDLNGDRDKLDQVLHSFDAITGTVRNSGQQAITSSLLDLGDGVVAFLTNEMAQGRVLNGDSDKLDNVLQSFNSETGTVRNSRQQAVGGTLLDLEAGGVAFLTSEAAQGRVLNGDKDKLDNVLQSFDPASGTVRNSRQQALLGSPIDLGDGFVAFLTNELSQGRALNGDGDKLDNVLQSFDATSGVVQNSGAQANIGSIVDLGAQRVAFTTSELAQGRVLNGDGDKLDNVLQVFDAELGIVQNTGQAV